MERKYGCQHSSNTQYTDGIPIASLSFRAILSAASTAPTSAVTCSSGSSPKKPSTTSREPRTHLPLAEKEKRVTTAHVLVNERTGDGRRTDEEGREKDALCVA